MNTDNKEVLLEVPLALQHLIRNNNKLLKDYQRSLMLQVEEANDQMMRLLRLDTNEGWKLDLERMVYARPATELEEQQTNE